MKRFICVLVAVAAIGCGGDWGPRYVSPELADAVTEFEELWGVTVQSNVRVHPFLTEVKGLCIYKETGRRPEILINPLYTDGFFKVVIHELGHCELYRAETPGDIVLCGEGIRKSVMTPYADVTSAIFNKYRSYYVDELFGHMKPLDEYCN